MKLQSYRRVAMVPVIVTIFSVVCLSLLYTPRTTHAAGTFVQSAGNVSSPNASTFSISFPSATLSGNTIMGYVHWNSSTVTLNSVTGCGNTYTLVNNPTTGGTQRAAGFYAPVVTDEPSCALTATFSGNVGSVWMAAHEVSGLVSTNPLDGSVIRYQNAPGTGTNAVSSGSIVTTVPGNYIFAATSDLGQGSAPVAGTGFVGRVTTGTNGLRTEDKTQATAGSVAGTFTTNITSGRYLTLVMAFKARDTSAPAVQLSAPASGAVVRGATVAVSATATDNVGVSGVQFLLDGVNLGVEDTTSPYSIVWNTASTSAGTHMLSARARDAVGNTTLAAEVSVTVDNQAPTGTISINGGAEATNNRNVTLTLSAADALSTVTQMRFSTTGTSYSAAENYATTKAYTLPTGTGIKTVYVQFKDAVGNWSAAVSDTISVDTTAPTISAVGSTTVTHSDATILWTTNEPATSQVEYGTSTAYGQISTLDPTLLTSHAVTLSGLGPNKKYSFRVRSKDAAGNERVGTNNSFTTLLGPDTLAPTTPSNVNAVSVSSTQVTVSWTPSTDNVAVSAYRIYRDNLLLATSTISSYTDTTVVPAQSYSYTVDAIDLAGNISPLSVEALVSVPAFVISQVGYTDVTPTSATISWTTDQPTNSQVEYGPTTSYGSMSALDTTLVTTHSQVLTDLQPETLYHYRVISTDGNGHTIVSDDDTFTATDAPVISLVSHSQSSGCVNATTCSVTLASPIQEGNLLVITASANNAVYVKDISGGGVFKDSFIRNGSPFGATRGFISGGYVLSSVATEGPVVVTFSGTTGGAQVNIREYSSSSGTLTLDAVGDNLISPASASFSGPSVVLSGTNDVLVGWASANTRMTSVDSPFGNIDVANDQTGAATADNINTNSGIGASWNAFGSVNQAVAAVMAFGSSAIPCTNTTLMDSRAGVDGAPVTAAGLTASTYGAAGTGTGPENWKWETSYTNNAFTWSSEAHRPEVNPMRFCVGGQTYEDTSSLGLKYDTSAGPNQFLHLFFPGQDYYDGFGVSPSSSAGMWFYTSLPANASINADVFTLYGINGGFINLILWGSGQSLIVRCEAIALCDASIPVTSNTWYWLSLEYKPGGIHRGAVYDASMNLVGSFQVPSVASDSPPGSMFFGNSVNLNSTPGAVMYFDKVKTCYLGNCEFPVLP